MHNDVSRIEHKTEQSGRFCQVGVEHRYLEWSLPHAHHLYNAHAK
jgi:hypothetical protein